MSDLIERLLNPRSFDHEALRKEAAARIRELEAELDRLRAEKAAIEAATIERCAQVADDDWDSPKRIANAIRALAKANETEGK
jgi:hypothetical protein